ncbi:hypothetical protein CcaverHIS002_0212690 [Cutaneotrichosporon cavernicola]|nr:hypothetical protein CcaverHIS002_0212690 [Cutaneotrichosporon cavernicola]
MDDNGFDDWDNLPDLLRQAPRRDNQPSRPMNAFFVYMRFRRALFANANPTFITGDLSKLLGAEWTALNASRKAPWQALQRRLMAAFKRKYPNYQYERKSSGKKQKNKSGDRKARSGKKSPGTARYVAKSMSPRNLAYQLPNGNNHLVAPQIIQPHQHHQHQLQQHQLQQHQLQQQQHQFYQHQQQQHQFHQHQQHQQQQQHQQHQQHQHQFYQHQQHQHQHQHQHQQQLYHHEPFQYGTYPAVTEAAGSQSVDAQQASFFSPEQPLPAQAATWQELQPTQQPVPTQLPQAPQQPHPPHHPIPAPALSYPAIEGHPWEHMNN